VIGEVLPALMANIARLDDEDDVFGGMGGVIADALQ
jgi:hypothetical protein